MSGGGWPGDWPQVMQDDRFVDFVAHYNGDRDYFECHELMEELWLEEGRHPLLQGLLQAAVGLYHWRNGNVSGAIKLMSQALRKLEGYPEAVLGLDLADLRSCLEQSLSVLREAGDGAPFAEFLLRVTDSGLAQAVENRIPTLLPET